MIWIFIVSWTLTFNAAHPEYGTGEVSYQKKFINKSDAIAFIDSRPSKFMNNGLTLKFNPIDSERVVVDTATTRKEPAGVVDIDSVESEINRRFF